jgi:hypothetical protein
MIFYTDKTLKSWQGGRQFWFFAIIRPEHKGKQHIVEHERVHIKQWYLTTFLAALAVGFSALVAHKHLGVSIDQLAPLVFAPPTAHAFLYLLVKQYRQWAEVQAYRVSLAYRPDLLETYATVLATKYKLGLSIDQARELLK